MPRGKPHSAEFKARPALESLQGAKTVGEVAAEHGLNPNLVGNWKARAESDLSRVFSAAEGGRSGARGAPGGGRRPASQGRRDRRRARPSSTGPA